MKYMKTPPISCARARRACRVNHEPMNPESGYSTDHGHGISDHGAGRSGSGFGRVRQSSFVLLIILLAAFGGLTAPAEPAVLSVSSAAVSAATSAPLEVIYIPRADLSRAPGYSSQGLFLPLSKLMALVNDATSATRAAALSTAAQKAPVFCTGLELSGQLGEALSINGTLAFEAPGAEWSATRIDDGTIPWVSQGNAQFTKSPSPSSGIPHSAFRISHSGGADEGVRAPSAFLARVGGATWLFAKGPGKGVIALRALLPAPLGMTDTTLNIGRFDAPCRLAMTLAPDVHLTSATLPIPIDAATTAAASAASRLTLWPAQVKPGWLRPRQTTTCHCCMSSAHGLLRNPLRFQWKAWMAGQSRCWRCRWAKSGGSLKKNRCDAHSQSEEPNPTIGTEAPGIAATRLAQRCSRRFLP
jgi:hypothetical protein